MKSVLLPEFFKHYRKLPQEIREKARQAYKIFQKDPFDYRLRFAPRGSKGIWVARIDKAYRVLCYRDDDETGTTVYWYWIGSHGEYDDLLRDI